MEQRQVVGRDCRPLSNAVPLPMPELVYRSDPAADGPANMAMDEAILESLPAGGGRLRWYAWREPTVSLGVFQRYADWEAAEAFALFPVVRRPSGGGAILHGSDLTYAIAVDRSHPAAAAPELLYDAVHQSAVKAFQALGLDASRVLAGHDAWPDRFLCFHRRNVGDVVIGASKVLGSAQRRHQRAVLQHGSILLRSATDLVSVWPVEWPSLEGVEELSGGSLDQLTLARALTQGIAERLRLEPVEDRANSNRSGGTSASENRFASLEWTRRR